MLWMEFEEVVDGINDGSLTEEDIKEKMDDYDMEKLAQQCRELWEVFSAKLAESAKHKKVLAPV